MAQTIFHGIERTAYEEQMAAHLMNARRSLRAMRAHPPADRDPVYRRQLQVVQNQITELQTQIEHLEKLNGGAWDDAKIALDELWLALRTALDNFARRWSN